MTTPASLNKSSSKDSAVIAPQRSFLSRPDRVYKLLRKAQTNEFLDDETILSIIQHDTAAYRNTSTGETALHVVAKLLNVRDMDRQSLINVVKALITACPEALAIADKSGNIPLHYAMAPESTETTLDSWRTRTMVVRMFLQMDRSQASGEHLKRNNVVFGRDAACSPLYRAIYMLPDDPTLKNSPTLEYIATVLKAITTNKGTPIVHYGNASDGDKPLSLLYRRFTRQFDLAEKFFAGDNSRPSVVEHRHRYKSAAGNTWKIIELLLREQEHSGTTLFRTLHRAVQGETPPDLLRYIVETNSTDLTVADEMGYLPLHYAAKFKPPTNEYSFPAFYSKYVIDELLYKFPEAAAKQDADGNYPMALAIASGKHWIGGGIKSLYDSFPEALQQIDLEEHPLLQRSLSMEIFDDEQEEKKMDDVIPDEQHDAIMLVQKADVDVSEVAISMWAHEEDAGVQMLGCVAITRLLKTEDVRRIALVAVPAVVNAMKAHPNEVIVQEKASQALGAMASADNHREVSFVATGAVAAIVGAMQAHVSDYTVQQESCGALAEILEFGGSDRATVVASVSGLTALVNAMAAHPKVADVQTAGCRALVALTQYDNANLPDLPRSQTEPLLLAAQSNFSQCAPAVQVLLKRLS